MKIEQQSDLTYRLNISSNDEIGSTSTALNSMMMKFHQAISNVANNAVNIATAAEQTSVITAQNSARIVEPQDQTTLVATAMEQMTITVENVAENVNDAVEAVKSADEKASNGHEIMQQTIVSVGQLVSQINTASQVINEFEIHSNEIVAVLDVIKGVAEQTNLLALNAAIEAARAGEQGRGFAVVADEVRGLAGRTQASTSEISEVIEKLKASAEQAIIAMEKSQELANIVVKQGAIAENSFYQVSESVALIGEMNNQIANESALGSAQTAEASQELVSLTIDLKTLVSSFKI
ncbi:MAG: methyl-accepting chemotaxis protein [Gammaproteobacteria bacterium]|nr:methyl-accepting chemotaxis protein [Gammaproteobacteria bacterium]